MRARYRMHDYNHRLRCCVTLSLFSCIPMGAKKVRVCATQELKLCDAMHA
jgi:hypothetical protein